LARELFAASDPYLDCCCPLLIPDENGRPRFFGSGTLVSIGDRYFLITAAHVLDEAATEVLYLPSQAELVELRGPASKTNAPAQGGRLEDKVDSSFVLIDSENAAKLKQLFRFLPMDLVDNSDSIAPGKVYRFCGFAWKFQQTNHVAQNLKSQRYTFLSDPLIGTRYAKWGFAEAFHIVARFSKDNVWDEQGRRVHSPDPHAMSGGPIFGIAATPGGFCVRLAGINIEFLESDRILAGVRITGVLERIRRAYPELSALVPMSTTIEIVHQEGSVS